jgi:hypothetical protein
MPYGIMRGCHLGQFTAKYTWLSEDVKSAKGDATKQKVEARFRGLVALSGFRIPEAYRGATLL